MTSSQFGVSKASSLGAAYGVIFSGVVAALQIGKLPPALPELSQTLGLSLMQSGFLLSLVQLAGMTLALAVGLTAEAGHTQRAIVRVVPVVLVNVAVGVGGFGPGVGPTGAAGVVVARGVVKEGVCTCADIPRARRPDARGGGVTVRLLYRSDSPKRSPSCSCAANARTTLTCGNAYVYAVH